MKRSEALLLRGIIESSVQYLDGNTSLKAIVLHSHWKENVSYVVGTKVQYNGKLWRSVQSHVSQTGWNPEDASSLWEQINETSKGTITDPIPYDRNMSLENGKYYTQDGVTYLCNRDTGNPVYNALSELVGLYVEVV